MGWGIVFEDSRSKSLLPWILFHRLHARGLILATSLFSAFFGILSPFFQKTFVDRILGFETTLTGGFGERLPVWLWIVGAFFAFLFAQGLSALAQYLGNVEGLRIQREVSERMYRKMLTLRSDGLKSKTVGEVVSIYAVDVPGTSGIIDQTLPMGSGIIFPILIGPIAVYLITGVPLESVWIYSAVLISVKMFLSWRQAGFFYHFKRLAAERTGIVNEWIQNMRIIRILDWVDRFESMIFSKREEETVNRVAMVTNGTVMASIGASMSFFINVIGISALVALKGDTVSPGELLALLWIFGVFLARPFRQVPWILTFCLDAMTSVRRVEAFLSLENPEPPVSPTRSATPDAESAGAYLSVRGLRLASGDRVLLREIGFDLAPSEFVAIVGEVGSGKSQLILSLMGETAAEFDSFRIGGKNALELTDSERRSHFGYVPQEGFVMSAPLRDNVVFQYDSSLESDENIQNSMSLSQFHLEEERLSDGLETEIGERGVNLSGGQKQRVNLARAHAASRSVIVLDDSLSALDVDTEQKILSDLILGVWKDRLRILVTHRLTVLSHVDRVIYMKGGRIEAMGSYQELLARHEEFRHFVASVQTRKEAHLDSSKGVSV